MKSTLSRKHYLWPLAVTMYTIWNTLLKPPASFSFFRTTFLGTLIQLRDQARTLLYFLTLRNICVSTIPGTPSSLNFHLIHHIYRHIHPILHGFVVLWKLFYESTGYTLYCQSTVKLAFIEGYFAITHCQNYSFARLYQPIPSGLCIVIPTFMHGYFTCIVRSLRP